MMSVSNEEESVVVVVILVSLLLSLAMIQAICKYSFDLIIGLVPLLIELLSTS